MSPDDDSSARSATLAGLEVVLFESRRAAEMASLVVRYGGVPISAPTLRETPRTGGDAEPARVFARDLAGARFDAVVFLTGIGARSFAAEVEGELPRAALAAALAHVVVIARGPKPQVALRELGVANAVVAPAPSTQREVAAALASSGLLRAGARIAVVEHGAPSEDLYDEIERAGAIVTRVPVYRWSLVADTAPLEAALLRLASGSARTALFTSAAQVDLAMGVAARAGADDAVRATLRAGVVGSIGPVCSARLRAEGLEPDVEPALGRMGHLVKAFAERAAAVLATKAARADD